MGTVFGNQFQYREYGNQKKLFWWLLYDDNQKGSGNQENKKTG